MRKVKATAVRRRRRRFCSRNTRSSVGSSTSVPTNHATRAWRSTRAHALGRNTKSRVGRRQINGKASRGKVTRQKERQKEEFKRKSSRNEPNDSSEDENKQKRREDARNIIA
jgi:hypothetical protein